MKNLLKLSEKLQNIVPLDIQQHFADQQRLTKAGVCSVLILNNSDWADRVFDENNFFSLADIMHDFVGLMAKDEFFVSRI